VEALKAGMLRQCGLEHPIQKFVDENFEAASQENPTNDDDDDDDAG